MKISFAMPKVNWIIKELKSLTKFLIQFWIVIKTKKTSAVSLSAGLLIFSDAVLHSIKQKKKVIWIRNRSLEKKVSGVEKLWGCCWRALDKHLTFSFHKFMKLRFFAADRSHRYFSLCLPRRLLSNQSKNKKSCFNE